MALDHGILNVPLSRRGNIDRQIDQFKALQAREAKAADKARLKAMRAEQAELRKLVAAVSDERMAELGKPHGLTAKQTRLQFIRAGWANPQAVIGSMNRELGGAV